MPETPSRTLPRFAGEGVPASEPRACNASPDAIVIRDAGEPLSREAGEGTGGGLGERARRMSEGPTIERARRLRKDMTRAESLLWRALRGHRLAGWHIRRQAPCGPYIADFLCVKARLVIEVDGATHSRPYEVRRDARRDAWFAANGYRVLRLLNADIYENFEGAIETILAHVKLD